MPPHNETTRIGKPSRLRRRSRTRKRTRTRTRTRERTRTITRTRTRTRQISNTKKQCHNNNNVTTDSISTEALANQVSHINRMQGALNSGNSEDTTVIGREDMRHKLRQTIFNAAEDGQNDGDHGDVVGGGAVFVTGSPGTGKTLCVQHVLKEEQPSGRGNDVPWIYVNCMALSKLSDVYGRVCGNHHVHDDDDAFVQHVRQGRRRVAVVDEVERLGTQRIPRLLTACTHPDSRVMLIAISNAPAIAHTCTAAVTHRTHTHRITTLCFHRYTAAELASIVRARLQGHGGVQRAAVELVCRKVAASTGDARAALEMVSRAVEGKETGRSSYDDGDDGDDDGDDVTGTGKKTEVDVRQMGGVVRDVLGGRDAAAIRGLPHTQKVLLCAAVKLLMHERSRFDVRRLRQYYVTLCDEHSLPRLSSREVMDMCEGLCSQGIVTMEPCTKGGRTKTSSSNSSGGNNNGPCVRNMRRVPLTFNMSAQDMARVLRDDNGVLSRILDSPWRGPKSLVNL